MRWPTRPEWETALREVDEGWGPDWFADWRRRFVAVREVVSGKGQGALACVEPGVAVHGMEVGRWLQRKRRQDVWLGLVDGPGECLGQLGARPLAAPEGAPAKPSAVSVGAFSGALRPLRSGKARRGLLVVSRGRVGTAAGR